MKRKLSPATKAIRTKIRTALTGRPDAITSAQLREVTKFKGAPPEFMRQILSMKRDGELLQHEGDTPRSSRYSLNVDQLPDPPPASAKKTNKRPYTKRNGPGKAERLMIIDRELAVADTIGVLRLQRDRLNSAITALEALQ